MQAKSEAERGAKSRAGKIGRGGTREEVEDDAG